MNNTTDDHIYTVILPAVDAMIQSITALITPWPSSVSSIDPGWILLSDGLPLLGDLNGDLIWLNSSNN